MVDGPHTPAPWIYNGEDFIVSNKGDIAFMGTGSINATVGDSKAANGRLIAAAPDLLEALQIHHYHCIRNQPEYSEYGEDAVAFRATRNAIRKARGE